MKILKWWILILSLELIALITSSGCSSSNYNDSRYEVFNFSSDDIRFKLKGTLIHEHPLFTFEYPKSFAKINDDDKILLNMRVTMVSFARKTIGAASSLPNSSLSVSVHEPGLWNDTDAETTVSNIITYQTANQEFRILENHPTYIAGIDAKYLSYSFHQPAREGFGYSPIPPYNEVVKFICFDYKGFIWRSCLSCLEEESQETEIYFQRLMDTFQIIE
jgi:hypothetical protein